LTIKQEKHQWSATRRRPCPNFFLEWLIRSTAHQLAISVSRHIIRGKLDSSHHASTKWHFASRIIFHSYLLLNNSEVRISREVVCRFFGLEAPLMWMKLFEACEEKEMTWII
jgi:hypothetical protein